MSLIFADSFDHYALLQEKWNGSSSSPNAYITSAAGAPRTGTQCLQIAAGAFGACTLIRQTTDCLIAGSFLCTQAGTDVFWLGNGGVVGYGQSNICIRLVVNSDRSLGAYLGNTGQEQAVSAPGVFQLGAYNALALRITVALAGRIRVWCNGVKVIDVTGYYTRNPSNAALNYVNTITLMGPGGTNYTCYHDDLYVLDCTDAVNNAYLGPLRIYASVPVANGAVQWTPSPVVANYLNVAEIPPDGNTSYNANGTVGNADQYSHPLNIAVPVASQIFAVQHCMDAEVDSGARSITSDVGGVLNPSAVALAAGYAIATWPYDQNPVTAAPWLASSFPLLAGPSVTA